MATEILMPVITEAGEDAVVTAWLVDEGSRVKAGQLIAEVQAEKVADEVRAPLEGVVGNLVPINQVVPQGQPICIVSVAGAEPTPAPSPAEKPVAAPSRPVRVVATPAAKRLARDLGVKLAGVSGTGPGGRITEADVRTAARESEPRAIELTGLRGVIARNVRRSHAETAPVTLTTTADVTDGAPEHITAWIVKTVAVALGDHPQLSGEREGDRFIPAPVAGIAVAVQTDEGLVAPVVREPAHRSVDEIAQAIAELAERARSKQLTTADHQGATFTVTNLGGYGIDAFTPIINPPQAAILGIGALRTAPGLSADGKIVARKHLTLSLTFDHAFVDGAPAAAFLAQVRKLLEEGVD